MDYLYLNKKFLKPFFSFWLHKNYMGGVVLFKIFGRERKIRIEVFYPFFIILICKLFAEKIAILQKNFFGLGDHPTLNGQSPITSSNSERVYDGKSEKRADFEILDENVDVKLFYLTNLPSKNPSSLSLSIRFQRQKDNLIEMGNYKAYSGSPPRV